MAIIISVLTFLYGLMCAFIMLMVLIQRGKSSMGLGNMGGGNQALFGSSGGQDIFQKITWICLVLLLGGSLVLSVLKGKYRTVMPISVKAQQAPANTSESAAPSQDGE